MNVPHGMDEVIAVYGNPKLAYDSDTDSFMVDRLWEETSMTPSGMLPGLLKPLYVHKLILEPLRTALTIATKDGWRPKTIGCFSPRWTRGSHRPSLHTWGIAVDVNADDNQMIVCDQNDPRRQTHEIPDSVISAFKQAGFFWGGSFMNRYDPMHFQLATGC